MKLQLTSQAAADIAEISDYLRERSPPSMQRVRAAIFDALQNLLLFPRVGRRQNVEGVRKLVTRRYGCLIYYLIDDEHGEVVILGIKHPARARDHWDS